MMHYVVLDGNLLDEVVLDGNLLDELHFDSNLFVKDVKMMYLQISSEVAEKRNFSKCQRNDKYNMSQCIHYFYEGNPRMDSMYTIIL